MLVFTFCSKQALHPPACLKRLQLLSRRRGITTRRRLVRGDGALLSPYATAASQRQPRAARLTVQAAFTASSLWYDHNPIEVCLLKESPCCASRPPIQRVLCSETSLVPELRLFFWGGRVISETPYHCCGDETIDTSSMLSFRLITPSALYSVHVPYVDPAGDSKY